MTARHPLVREALLSAAAAASIAALLAWLGPPGSDLAAHAYQRTLFLEHGFTLWNNFWYAGRYSFVTYSILYYPLAALFGIRLLAVATVALAALAFAVIVWREWGPSTRWSSRSFAVVWAGIVLSAAFPFALGFALALLALWALQRGARWQFAGLAALTLAASPLALLLLGIFLVGVTLAQRVSLHRNWVPAAALVGAAAAQVLLWRIFPGSGRFPFHTADLITALAFGAVGLVLTWRVESARLLRYFFAVYFVATVVARVVPSELGGNVDRFRFVAIPLAVLVFTLRRWRPLPLAVALVAGAISWNVSPLVASYVNGSADVTANASVWPPAIAYLRAHLAPSYRVEAVDTATHFPAVYLADAGIPIARGWFRQDDFPQNQVLYGKLGREAYVAWLHSLGIRYVVLANAPVDYSSRAEARLVRSGRAGLIPVFQTKVLTIYAVPHAREIVTGPGRPAVTSLNGSRIVLSVPERGSYRLAVRWSPYWRATGGCLSDGRDGMIRVRTNGPRTVRLAFKVDVVRALDTLAGQRPRCGRR